MSRYASIAPLPYVRYAVGSRNASVAFTKLAATNNTAYKRRPSAGQRHTQRIKTRASAFEATYGAYSGGGSSGGVAVAECGLFHR